MNEGKKGPTFEMTYDQRLERVEGTMHAMYHEALWIRDEIDPEKDGELWSFYHSLAIGLDSRRRVVREVLGR